jgi:hypothetical protein
MTCDREQIFLDPQVGDGLSGLKAVGGAQPVFFGPITIQRRLS